MSMSAIAAFGIGVLLLVSKPADWLPQLSDFIKPAEPVLVVIVGSPNLVDSVRQAVSSDRIVADTGDAFALVDRRVIAASADAASGPINRLGWIDREIEVVSAATNGGRNWEENRHKGRGAENLSAEDREKADQIAKLVQKPRLNAAEAGILLQHMDATGQF